MMDKLDQVAAIIYKTLSDSAEKLVKLAQEFNKKEPPKPAVLKQGHEYRTVGDHFHRGGWSARVGGDSGTLRPNRYGHVPVMHYTPFVLKLSSMQDIKLDGLTTDALVYHEANGRAIGYPPSYDLVLTSSRAVPIRIKA